MESTNASKYPEGRNTKTNCKKAAFISNLFIQPKQSWNPIPFHEPDGFDESKLTNICNVLADDSKSLEIKQRIGSDSQRCHSCFTQKFMIQNVL